MFKRREDHLRTKSKKYHSIFAVASMEAPDDIDETVTTYATMIDWGTNEAAEEMAKFTRFKVIFKTVLAKFWIILGRLLNQQLTTTVSKTTEKKTPTKRT